MGQPWPLFHLISIFSNKHHKLYNKLMWKISIQYPALELKLTTFWLRASTFNH